MGHPWFWSPAKLDGNSLIFSWLQLKVAPAVMISYDSNVLLTDWSGRGLSCAMTTIVCSIRLGGSMSYPLSGPMLHQIGIVDSLWFSVTQINGDGCGLGFLILVLTASSSWDSESKHGEKLHETPLHPYAFPFCAGPMRSFWWWEHLSRRYFSLIFLEGLRLHAQFVQCWNAERHRRALSFR